MAENWIAVDHNTPQKPEVVGVAMELGIPIREAFGLVVEVWIWADRNTYDGTATCNGVSVTSALLDAVFGVTGLSEALQSVGWLVVKTDESIGFPNFGDHNGNTAKSRKKTNRRVNKHREQKKTQGKRKCNGVSVTQPLPQEQEQEQEHFVRFWKSFKLKIAKPNAEKAFGKAIAAGVDPELIIEQADRYHAACEVSDTSQAHPATWLNAKRWEDEDMPAPRAERQNGKPQGKSCLDHLDDMIEEEKRSEQF